jgi:sensor domain CHASE-containing protein
MSTISAVRDGSLKQDYVKITKYQTDEDSEKRVKTLSTVLPIVVVGVVLVILICLWKIKQYTVSLKETEMEIENQDKILRVKMEEITRLRRLKMMRNEIA